jgi:uncharacterized protein (DUF2249 family)
MARERIVAETRVARALDADPGLLARLIAFHAAFRRLKNPVLRRTMARLATFADAARIAGVPLAALLAVANDEPTPAAGGADADAAIPAEPMPDWARDAAAAAALDVRPILAGGRDPFAAIMAAAKATPPGGVLAIEAPFDPAPLRRVLSSKGYADHALRLAPDHWRILFRKPAVEAPDPAPDAARRGAARTWIEGGRAHVDVRGLDPPLPMLAVLRLLESPAAGDTVIVHHEREPLFLYPELAARGWRHAIVDGEPGEVRLVLSRAP